MGRNLKSEDSLHVFVPEEELWSHILGQLWGNCPAPYLPEAHSTWKTDVKWVFPGRPSLSINVSQVWDWGPYTIQTWEP